MNIELQHRRINFWIATFGKINILNNFSWTWRFPQTTNNIMSPLGLNFEFPMENNRRKFNSVLKIDLHYEWIYKFSFESPTGGEPNSNSTTGKTNTLYLKMLPKKASKILQKCNFYFKLLLKCFEIGSKCNSTPKTLLKRLQKCGSTFNMLQIKGKQKQLNASTHLLQNRAQFLDWHSKSLNN